MTPKPKRIRKARLVPPAWFDSLRRGERVMVEWDTTFGRRRTIRKVVARGPGTITVDPFGGHVKPIVVRLAEIDSYPDGVAPVLIRPLLPGEEEELAAEHVEHLVVQARALLQAIDAVPAIALERKLGSADGTAFLRGGSERRYESTATRSSSDICPTDIAMVADSLPSRVTP